MPDVLGEQIAVLCEEKVPVVSTTFGLLPSPVKDRLHDTGVPIIGTATCLEEAQAIAEAGYTAVVAQGFEAGGHRGSFTSVAGNPPLVGLMALLPQIADAVSLPVIAAGGIMDGRGIVAALALGASAVQMGTAFLTTTESGADDVWVQALLNDPHVSTVLTKSFTGKLARAVRNAFTETMSPCDNEAASYPLQMHITEAIRSEAKRQGRGDYLPLWAGQGVRLARRTEAAALIRSLRDEVDDCVGQFTAANTPM
ncbi:MAG: nitronate monooxygenase [Fibrella sp.]|nr:nitronate monooxygenase [Armatimonadota bacterium]